MYMTVSRERFFCFFFQAEDGIRDLVRSRGLGDVYKRQMMRMRTAINRAYTARVIGVSINQGRQANNTAVPLSLIHI